ncbi:MAG: cell surface protein [Rhodopirellula sp. TMED11]|nr:MAG: cell surface protein [Rhodopirellula sp. TMED11]
MKDCLSRSLLFLAAFVGICQCHSLVGPSSAHADETPATENQLAVYPPEIKLNSARDFQSFVAVIQRPDGITEDASSRVKWSVGDASKVKLDGFQLFPLADGQTELHADLDGKRVSIPVVVGSATTKPPISFTNDVMPVLTRAGCNTGSCHGAARGKDGFRLSLFGFDPEGDHFRITREIGVRRINLAVPTESLLIKKSIGTVQHTGGKLFGEDSEYYAMMLEWLADGAPKDPTPPPTVDSVAIYPSQAVIEGDGTKQRFVAVATYSDGSTRDVTRLAAFTSNNSGTAAIDNEGNVTAGRRGEAFVMARFDTHTVGSQVLALPKDLQYQPQPVNGNYIDVLVGKKLQQLRITPSGLCTDAEFIRRATVDITGMLPSVAEVEAFVSDASADKRAQLIDRLLERKEFSEIWAMKFAQLLMIKSSNQVSYKSAFLYSNWLTDNFARNVPIDQMVRDLLTSTGGTFGQPATNFYEIERDTLKTSENVAQVFMGIRTQCAQCHNHPFDRWTMDDYYGFASFFTQVGRKGAEDYRERIVYNRGSGETNHIVTKKPQPPTFLGGDAPETRGKDRREVVANWLTSPDNPFFATSIANRVWAHYMGVGIVDPVDDIRVSNPASNPELFDDLGEKLIEYKYDFRSLVRDICNSNAYQRTADVNDSNAHDSRNYAHAVVRRIPAESLLDCICQVTEAPDKFTGLPLGARAVQIADGRTSNYFLTTFGRAPRDTVCDCEARTDPSLSQALHLLNGTSISNKVAQGAKVRNWMQKESLTEQQVLDRIYMRCLARKPNEKESADLMKQVTEAEDKVAALEDIFWAVLNSREFVFNH